VHYQASSANIHQDRNQSRIPVFISSRKLVPGLEEKPLESRGTQRHHVPSASEENRLAISSMRRRKIPQRIPNDAFDVISGIRWTPHAEDRKTEHDHQRKGKSVKARHREPGRQSYKVSRAITTLRSRPTTGRCSPEPADDLLCCCHEEMNSPAPQIKTIQKHVRCGS